MSNFDFLKEFDETLWKLGNRIEKQVNTSPSAVKADATTFLEHILKELLNRAGLKYNSRKPFTDQVDAVFRSDLKMSNAYRESIKNAYNFRNKIHDDFVEIEKHEIQDALQLHEKLFYIARKFYRDYNDDYDEYKGVPDFKPLEIDSSSDEIAHRDFNEIVDVKYDYCVVCGKPNHLNYSIYCHECSRRLDNSNNFISVRNAFGKDARFTKEDLIEYGMAEGYVNQFINSLVREDMLKVAGRFITFNNMNVDEYLESIDSYISVGELITRFKEDKISPSEIKKSREYILGSRKNEPFYQFYKITNREIIKKFEKDLLTTHDIFKSMEYTTVTYKQINRWYDLNMNEYKKGNFNESFLLFNDLLVKNYLELKRKGISEDEIRNSLMINDAVYDFMVEYKKYFTRELKQIKIDLLSRAIKEGKTKAEIIEYAGVSEKEYLDLVKVSDFKKDDFSKLRNEEIESRKKEFLKYLLNFDLKIACRKAKLTMEDFYDFYENGDVSSQFYIKSTEMLMDKYLLWRSYAKTRKEALEKTGIKEEYLNRWLSRSLYSDFKDRNLKVTVDLILKGLKQNKTYEEIAETADVKISMIDTYIRLGQRGNSICRPLSVYYEEKIIPRELDRFLNSNEKSFRKKLESVNITAEELNRYYEIGKHSDERFSDFYTECYQIKKGIYVYHIDKGKSHQIAMRESQLSEDEYAECREDIENYLREIKFTEVMEAISNNKTSTVAATRAGCSVEDIYDWYFRGREGDEDYVEFYKAFHNRYVNASVVPMQEKIDNENANIEVLIKSNKDKFTRKDVDIWIEHGLIDVTMNLEADDDEDENNTVSINRFSFRPSNDKDYDVEDLKRQILKDNY